LAGIVYLQIANNIKYKYLTSLRFSHDPASVINTVSLNAYQSILLQLYQGLKILLKPWALRRKPWHKARCVPVLLLVIQEVSIEIALINCKCNRCNRWHDLTIVRFGLRVRTS
jgi:hypothetical protein